MLESIHKSKLLEKVKDLFNDAIAYDSPWQRKAREAFEFRDNRQWDKMEEDILNEERRPALTLNVVKSHIDLIMGLNEDIKKRYICSPVSTDDGFLCEVINNVVYWLYQKSDWESEEDNAYESALISGRGWVAIDFDVDENQINDIKITLTSIPIHEVRFDPAARKKDLSDASYIIWDRWLSLEDFCIKYPRFESKARMAFADGNWPRFDTIGEDSAALGHDINDESDYDDEMDVGYYDSKKNQIRVMHMEYWKYEKVKFVLDPETNSWRKIESSMSDFMEEWNALYPGNEPLIESQIQKNLYWLQFCGNEILLHAKSPIKYPGFSLVPCFLYSDVSRRQGYHYGVVELMKDPQREINKRTSQTLNLFNQQVQPGVYAESRAFVNTDQAEQSMKEPGSITWLQDGAISQNRFQERSVPNFPTAVLQMGEYAREMMRHITGINPDLLGMNDKRTEPGIVVQLRQQQGMAILKPAFKAYSEMKKQIFERLVRIIMMHMPDTQILKIMGEGNRYQLQDGVIIDTASNLKCNLRDVEMVSYDIDSEPESNSMTTNALEIATFMELQKNGIPVDPKVIIGKTNLPMSDKLAWISYIEESQKAASDANAQAMQLEQQKLQFQHEQAMTKLQLDAQTVKRKADDARDKDMLKVSMDQERLKVQAQRDQQTAQLKMIQIVGGLKVDGAKLKQNGIQMLLDANHDNKRLLLDTAEVMANAMYRGAELEIKAVLDMYREAIKAQTLDKAEDLKLASKVFDVLIRASETQAKIDSDEKKVKDVGTKSMQDVQKK